MASVGQQFADWTDMSPSQAGSGLSSLAAAYLANKAGLIDLQNPGQRRAFDAGGMQGIVKNKIANAILPPVQQPPSIASLAPDNIDIGGGFNPAAGQGVAPPAAAQQAAPVAAAIPGAAVPGAETAATTMAGDVGGEMAIEEGLPSFLALFGMA